MRAPAYNLSTVALLMAAILIHCAVRVGAQEAAPEPPATPAQVTTEAEPEPTAVAAPEATLADQQEHVAPGDEETTAKGAMLPADELFRALPRFGQSIFAAPPAATAGMPTANTPVPPTYVIGPGDALSLCVWARERQQLAQTLPVSAEGFAVLPLLGSLTVAGQTLGQLRQALSEAYGEFYADPTVTLVVAEQRIVEVYVTGEARRPGRHTLVGMATVFTALYAAGGPSAIGSYRDVQLLRQGQAALHIDLYDYLLRGHRDQDVLLQPGDTLFIPHLQAEVGVAGQVRRPARYELCAETTVAEALEMAGGLQPTAYAPTMHLWRATAHQQWHLSILDCSEGDSADLQRRVQDGDLLQVSPILSQARNTVEITGAVRRPGVYPVEQGDTIGKLLTIAEGLAVDAHMGTGILRRLNDDLDYEMVPFNVRDIVAGAAEADLPLQPCDVVEIFSQQAVEPAFEVEVSGAVVRPAWYTWTKGMRVSHLVFLAGGPQPGAYLPRADLLRLTTEKRRELIKVNLRAALDADPDADIELARGDTLQILWRDKVTPASVVHVDGCVRKPGTYARHEGMRASDLILTAGGLLANAGPTVEFAPGRFEGSAASVRLRLIGGPSEYRVEPDLLLSDDDSVSVGGRGDFKSRAELVYIQGQVRHTGSYVLKSGESAGGYTLWDLLQEGGGLLPEASPAGIVLYRRRSALLHESQEQDLNRVVSAINQDAAQPSVQLSRSEQTAAMSTTVQQGVASLLTNQTGMAIIVPPAPVSMQDWVEAIPVQGTEIVQSKGKRSDLELRAGDTVVVPRRVNTVTVLGAVARSGAVPHIAKEPCRSYLERAGGLRQGADTARMVVVHSNGAVTPIRSDGRVAAGDVIVVPSRHTVRTVQTESRTERWLRSIVSIATAAIIFR